MIHQTLGRSRRLNHAMSKNEVMPAFPNVWRKALTLGANSQSIPFSERTLAGEFSEVSRLLGKLEEGGYAE